MCGDLVLRDIGRNANLTIGVDDSYWLDPASQISEGTQEFRTVPFIREWFLAILRKHGSHDIDDNIELCLIGRCYINENISSVQSDFAVF